MESDDKLTAVDRQAIATLGDPNSTELDYLRASLAVQAAILGELRELRELLNPVAELLPDFLPRLKTLAAAGSVMNRLGGRR